MASLPQRSPKGNLPVRCSNTASIGRRPHCRPCRPRIASSISMLALVLALSTPPSDRNSSARRRPSAQRLLWQLHLCDYGVLPRFVTVPPAARSKISGPNHIVRHRAASDTESTYVVRLASAGISWRRQILAEGIRPKLRHWRLTPGPPGARGTRPFQGDHVLTLWKKCEFIPGSSVQYSFFLSNFRT
jgi:hypothetical protein